MEESKKYNLFCSALENHELEQFILGLNNYFVLDREFGGHWQYGSFKQNIEEYLQEKDGVFEPEIWDYLLEIMNESKDLNLFLDNLVGYLNVYYHNVDFHLLERRVKETPSNFISKIKSILVNNKNSVSSDKRGTGVEWHSDNGLLGSISRNLEIINQRGGPDFLPNES